MTDPVCASSYHHSAVWGDQLGLVLRLARVAMPTEYRLNSLGRGSWSGGVSQRCPRERRQTSAPTLESR
ncbi:MAG: hypothetical protein OXM87_12555 [Truepera sp.]|nr:hypothetical protein [Truepera sp.]